MSVKRSVTVPCGSSRIVTKSCARHLLDPVGLGGEKGASSREAGVVYEESDRRVPLEHRRGGPLDCCAVADVADFPFRADLAPELTKPLLPAREKHALPAPLRKR